MASKAELKAIITADNKQLKGKLNESEKAVKGFGGLADKAMMAAAGGIAAAGAGAALASKKFMDFETSMAEVNTLMDEGQDAMSVYGDDVKRLSEELGVAGGNAEVASGLYQTLSSGITGAGDATQFLETAIKAAKGGMTDTHTAVDALSTVVNAYGLEAGEASRVSDMFFTAVKRGKTTFGEMAGTIGRVAAIAPSLGVGFDEIAAGVSTLTAAGQSTEEAATALRATIKSLMQPSAAMKDRFEELGVTTGSELIDKFGGLQGALQALTEGMGETEKAALFPNVRAMQAVFPLVGKQAESFQGNLDAMADSAGAADEAHEKMAETSETKFTKIKNAVMNILTTLGGPLLATLEEMGQAFMEAFGGEDGQDVVEGIKDAIIAARPALVGFAAALGFIAGLIRDNAQFIGPLVAGIVAAAAAYAVWTAATWLQVAASGALTIALGPVTVALIAIAAAVAAAIFVYQNWEEITQAVTESTQKFANWLGNLAETTRKAMGAALSFVVDTFSNLFELQAQWLDTLFKLGTDLLQRILDGLNKVWGDFAQFWTDLKDEITGVLGDVIDKALGWGKDIVQGIWDGIRRRWGAFVNWFRDKWEDFKGKFTEFFGIQSPSTVFMGFGKDIVEGFRLGLKDIDVVMDAALDRVSLPQAAPRVSRTSNELNLGPVNIPIDGSQSPAATRDAVRREIEDVILDLKGQAGGLRGR